MAFPADELPVQRHLGDPHAYLAAIVESSDDAILSKDLNGIIQSCNAAAERIFGYSAAELIGQSVLKLIPPERRAEEEQILARIRRGDQVDHFETVRVRKDGRRIDISLTVSALRDHSGTIVGASKVARDITERKAAAAALAAQDAWFRITLSSIADGVIGSKADGTVSYLNPAAESLTGWSAQAALGQPLDRVFRLIDERSRQPVDSPAAMVLCTGHARPLTRQAVLIARNGTERAIDDSAAPICDAEGRVLGVVLVFRDVEDVRRVAVARQEAETDRERLLAAERAARAEAERASRIKDDFIAMVSHELRTPLNAILGWTQLMARSPADLDLVERGLEVVARNTRLQAQLVSDLLDISRIVEGKLGLEVHTLDLREVVDEAIDTVAQEAEARGIRVVRRVDHGRATVAGDGARLQQVVWNLLSNAIKFTPPGGEVTVALRSTGTDASIVVADTGAGIRADVLPHIFDRFHQADRTITRRFGGLGIGLAIVKHLVDLHGGRVLAESAGAGAGATFTVTLPLGVVPGTRAHASARDDAADAAADVTLGGVSVLVVEDEPDTQQFLRRLLESHGASVVTAGTASDALAAFRERHADVLISDIGLPGVDGYELVGQVRRECSGGPAVAAIALTAYARAEDRRRALRAGYQAHVTKPVDGAELVAMVASLVDLADREGRVRARG